MANNFTPVGIGLPLAAEVKRFRLAGGGLDSTLWSTYKNCCVQGQEKTLSCYVCLWAPRLLHLLATGRQVYFYQVK